MKTFYRWVIENCTGRDDPVGDLAYDMKRDSDNYPKRKSYEDQKSYLYRRGGSLVVDAFEEAWQEYKDAM